MEIVLARHAEPAWICDGKSVLDPELTPRGRRQAEQLAVRLRALRPRPTELVVSTTRRTRQTAEPIIEALGLQPDLDSGLEEIRLPPAWDGAPAEAVQAEIVEARGRNAEAWWAGLPGGEAFPDFAERVRGSLWARLERCGLEPPSPARDTWTSRGDAEERRVVIVGHGGTNAVITALLLGIEHVPWAWERFVMLHAAITRLKAKPLLGGLLFGLREHSDAGHLEPELRSR